MAVELWLGQEFDTTHERRALHEFMAAMQTEFGASSDFYLVLANYYLDGRQIDLTVLKRDAIIVIELKECNQPFRATENGDWMTISNDNTNEIAIGTGSQNPFEQAKDYRFKLVNLLTEHQDRFLSPAKAQSLDFYHVSAFVAISPTDHPDSVNQLPHLPWFRLVSFDKLPEVIAQQTSPKLHFIKQELRTLVKDVLRLRQADLTLNPSGVGQAIPHQLGRYRIMGLLGQGGMGAVYRAYDPDLDREVVVKFITGSGSRFDRYSHERFRREVQAASQFNHPHIVTIYDVDFDDEPPYVVMELLTGGTLEERLRHTRLSWQEMLILLRLLAEALGYAHQKGVIHRDVKPANIMFSGDELHSLKLVDFGLARSQNSQELTQVGMAIGTPAYMSPEQARGEEVNQQTDIFAVGMVLFEAVTGINPLRGENPIASLLETASPTPIDIAPLRQIHAPTEVMMLIERAIQKDRRLRYETCQDLLSDLDSCLDTLIESTSSITLTASDSRPYRISAIQQAQQILYPPETEIEPPYGTIRPDSKFYVERPADTFCWEAVSRNQAATIFIQAPRQTGKSSLMRRIIARVETQLNKQPVFIDFQKFPTSHFEDEEGFLIEFCLMISEALNIPEAIDRFWGSRRTNIIKCSRYLADYIIPQIEVPLILAMDEVERMLTSPFQANFFGMLRTWHNDRAYDPNFSQLTLFLSSSTEPYLFIDNSNQSPFNVAEVVSLEDFTLPEIQALNQLYHTPLDQAQLNHLIKLVGGHPFLIRSAMYQLATGKLDFETLIAKAIEDTGPFGDHIRHYLLRVLQHPELKQALAEICRQQHYEENQIFYRLKGAGLIKRVEQRVVLRNDLYRQYFEEHFNG